MERLDKIKINPVINIDYPKLDKKIPEFLTFDEVNKFLIFRKIMLIILVLIKL